MNTRWLSWGPEAFAAVAVGASWPPTQGSSQPRPFCVLFLAFCETFSSCTIWFVRIFPSPIYTSWGSLHSWQPKEPNQNWKGKYRGSRPTIGQFILPVRVTGREEQAVCSCCLRTVEGIKKSVSVEDWLFTQFYLRVYVFCRVFGF